MAEITYHTDEGEAITVAITDEDVRLLATMLLADPAVADRPEFAGVRAAAWALVPDRPRDVAYDTEDRP